MTSIPLHIRSEEIYDGKKFTTYARVNTKTLTVKFVMEEDVLVKGGGEKIKKTILYPMELQEVLDRQTGVKLHVKTHKSEILELLMKKFTLCDFEDFYEGIPEEEQMSSSGDDKEEESDGGSSKKKSGGKTKKRKYPFHVGDESECAYLMRNSYDDEEFVMHGFDMTHTDYNDQLH